MLSDPIADLLVRLANAAAAGQEKLVVPHSKMKEAILAILVKEGVVAGSAEKSLKNKKMIEINLTSSDRRVFPDFVRLSKPGRRLYVKAREIPRPLKGMGLVVLSTPQGVLTGKEARRRGVGGELLFTEH